MSSKFTLLLLIAPNKQVIFTHISRQGKRSAESDPLVGAAFLTTVQVQKQFRYKKSSQQFVLVQKTIRLPKTWFCFIFWERPCCIKIKNISRLQASLSTQNWQSMKILEGFPRRYKIKSFLAHSPKIFCSWPNWRQQWRRCTVWQATRPPSTGEIWRRCHLRSSVHWKEEKIMVINFSRNPHQQKLRILEVVVSIFFNF